MSIAKKDYFIHHTAEIESKVTIGKGSYIWNNAQLRTGCVIGENTIISKNVFIDAECTVGSNVKIQNNVSVYKGVFIEDRVFVGPSVVFTNDLIPRAFNADWSISSTIVREGASIGAGSVIICGTTLDKYCMIGAGTVVTKSVPSNALVVGNPHRIIGAVYTCGSRIQHQDIDFSAGKATNPHTDETVTLGPELIQFFGSQ